VTLTWNNKRHLIQPFIGGFMYNEPAVFLPFDPDATTAPAPIPIPGIEGLTCAIKQEVE